MTESLWGDEFVIDEKPKTKKILNKIKEPKKEVSVVKQVKSKKISLDEKLEIIKTEVYNILGKQRDNVIVIRNRDNLFKYIYDCIHNGIIAIDTETNNTTDTYNCKLMGLCLYSPGLKQAYIPVNHVNKDTRELLPEQVSTADIRNALELLVAQRPNYFESAGQQTYGKWYQENIKPKLRKEITECITHNGKFDYEVLKRTCNVDIPIDWDSLIGAKILDENEKSAGLKEQYIAKIDPEQEKYHIDDLFEGVDYAVVDPDIFALYSATDSMMTYKLYEWQKERFNQAENLDISSLAEIVEMPLVTVIANMELTGMEVDNEYADLLSKKFHSRLDKLDADIAIKLDELRDKIDAWRLTADANKKQIGKNGKEGKSKSEQLTEPINLASPTQLAILFYDVLRAPVVDKKQPRATGEEALQAIKEKLNLPLCDLLLKRRELVKLLTTYIDPIPNLALNYDDRRVRTKFNQYGAATGRLSSGGSIKTPDGQEIGGLNFQNIPSHEKTIRMLFKAKDGYRIIGGDFSAQEPRLTAFMSQDPAMIKAYNEGKDLYSVIASMSFDRKYEDCLEFYPEGTKVIVDGREVIAGHKNVLNVEGKQYRNMAKSILLGIEYGRGAASVGEQIGKSKEEAQKIIDNFFKSFPSVKKFIDESIRDAHERGYVTDVAGRHRRLPDAQLPMYEVKYMKDIESGDFNPFLCCKDRADDKINNLINLYKNKCSKIKYAKEYEALKNEALANNIEIHSNTGFIAQAERQAVNSRIQGGAATLTKCALIKIFYDKRLKDIGAYLINTVHDEILIEAPEDKSEEAAKLLVEDMITSAKEYVTNVPMSCDAYNVNAWYVDEYFSIVEKEFKKFLENGMSPEEAFEAECSERTESTRSQIYEIIGGFLNGVIPAGVDSSYKSLTRISD